MGKILCLAMAIVFMFCGCIKVNMGGTEKEVIGKIAARHLGNGITKKYPVIADDILALSKDILDTSENDIIEILVDNLILVITNRTIDDPLLIADIRDLAGLIKIDPEQKITEEQMNIIRAVARGLIEGIEYGGVTNDE